jgi:hypothetical protein
MFKRSVVKKVVSLLAFAVLFILPGPTSAQINNCCHIDRQCTTEAEWVSGYYAFHNSICAAPQQAEATSPRAPSPPGASKSINNCCFTGWQCDSNADWVSGYFAFQANQCDSSQSGWQAQWRQREAADASNRQPPQQAQEWEGKRNRQSQAAQAPQQRPLEWDLPFCGRLCCFCGPRGPSTGTISIGIDLTNPNRREDEASDGTPVTLNPNFRD